MIGALIRFSVKHKNIIFIFIISWILVGLYSLRNIKIGAFPDITNNQVQVITTSRNLSTQDIEQFVTYPIELEMANLPGVREIRSISKFGLSVVTIVFEDDMGTYLPRQLISEKIESAKQNIPEGYGTPELGPITTGLGEIYQYILDVKPGYENLYSAMELRTIQDWIVKRHLTGIPGVVEVNTWGGYLKQYEVSVDPSMLNNYNLSIVDVFNALEKNNENTGGAYIEKGAESYFIRGQGMIQSLTDIGNIQITLRNDLPVLIKNVAHVNFGYANRFGAITGNGEGEKVLGQVMMLKDANPKKVIDEVKQRVEEINKLLPEGVFINGFLDRSELIERTTNTITENLSLGALIVIVVVIILLGNYRSGFIVASVIPLALLFSITMMNFFDIQANLMSLGAMDFGIIIDGAVIIVEFTLFQMVLNSKQLSDLKTKTEIRNAKDLIAIDSSTRMMKSAIFGQIIILIVFIPILTLGDIEGKLFKPMAISFGFALVGAIILCLTYVPALSSILLKPNNNSGQTFSEKMINSLIRIYKPILNYALSHRATILTFTLVLIIFSGFIFRRIGGEFIPTLDEGDFVIQPVLKPGTSLSETVRLHTEMEKLLINEYPEIDQIVTRIGAAEVPTDPMSMEMTDVIVKLKDKDQWTTTNNKNDLADKMKESLNAFAGIEFEFTQPIEMRFNELITGVRSDVAIKIFGNNLDSLDKYANQIRVKILDVEGASDISVEKVVGLPQIRVGFDRTSLARYGIDIADVNRLIRTAYAGQATGIVFEEERRFDLVVRLKKDARYDIESIKNLLIRSHNGSMIPLSEVANVSIKYGPAQISRDNTRRRIVIGINVRNRDVESLVEEIQGIVNYSIDLEEGYYIEYGGQFENFQNALSRLKVAVPISLALIFIMLYFTFRTLYQSLLIYAAVPLATIGGILSLFMRGMPFSISAGIGFIALFGIAVLNGIILIEYLNELKRNGVSDIRERTIQGATQRLRPVLLTASAAALGFFPMAFSTSAGAEVQRPLATVVIGGLITATILTLIVLPVLYSIVEERIKKD